MNTGIVEGMGEKIEMWESTQEYSEGKDIKRESTRNRQGINRKSIGNQLRTQQGIDRK